MSVTVAVHVVGEPELTEDGLQFALVLVVRSVTVSANVPELAAWLVSLLYVPVLV